MPPTIDLPVPVSDQYSKQLQRIRIQSLLVSLCKTGKFFAVSYDKTTGSPIQVDPSAAPSIPPVSCVANEVSSNFELDPRMGRRLARRRVGWKFQVICVWDQEVSLETFEETLAANPPTVSADAQNHLGQARLHLLSSFPTHPVQQQPSSGTRCVFLFEVESTRP